jgi:hypothetical protein
MDLRAAMRCVRRLAAGVGIPVTTPHPGMLRHAFFTTMPDAGPTLPGI